MPPDRRESEISGFDDEIILKTFLCSGSKKILPARNGSTRAILPIPRADGTTPGRERARVGSGHEGLVRGGDPRPAVPGLLSERILPCPSSQTKTGVNFN